MFSQLGWMVCIVMAISLICALTLIPMLSAQMLKKDRKSSKTFDKLYAPIQKFLDKLDIFYANSLTWVVKHKTVTIIIGVLVFIGSIMLSFGIGSEFIPQFDNSQISGNFQLPVGANVERSKVIAKKFESAIKKKYPEITTLSYTVGIPSEDDNNSDAQMQTSGTNYVSFRIKLSNVKERKRDIFEISEGIRQELSTYPELYKYNVVAGGDKSITSGSTVDVEIVGYDFDVT